MNNLIQEIKQKKKQGFYKIPRHKKAFYMFHVIAITAIILMVALL
ncbi:hypothetical protein [Nitrosopumilus zosterae]|nr:hypothetical protein [Nitrosopumilus zosterae]